MESQLIFNNICNVLEAALDGFGLAYVREEIALPHINKSRLKRVLEKWPKWDGYHLYYPSQRQSSPAFVAVVEALRYRVPRA